MRRAAPALAALAVLAGCGDDGPTRQEFATKANAVCRDIEREGSQLGERAPRTPQDVVAFADRAERSVVDGVKRLEAIERPGGRDGEKATRFVQLLSAELDADFVPALRQLRTAARARDAQGLRAAAERLQRVDTRRSDALARELGAIACAD